MRITVVTPSYNQAQYLEETIQSVLSQNYPDLEYIIMDGGSKDRSVDVIRKYEKHLAFWRSERDGGQTNAVNAGFERATGEVVTFLNSDDYFDKGALRAIAESFSNTDAGVVYGDYTLVTEAGKPFIRRKEIPFDFDIMLYGVNIVGQPSAFFKRSLLHEHGFLDNRLQYMMDYEFWLRLATGGVKFHHIKRNLSFYRYQPTSKTVAEPDKQANEVRIVRARFAKGISKAGMRWRGITTRLKRQWVKLMYRGTIDYLGGPLRWVAYRARR